MGHLSRLNQTDRVADWVTERIRLRIYRPGARLPSIRALSAEMAVSPFTVAAAYDRLKTEGVVLSRPGAGVFVRRTAERGRPSLDLGRVDMDWLLGHMLSGDARGPGTGVLPMQWLGGLDMGSALRALGREGGAPWLGAGQARGFEPLRHHLQLSLAARGVVAGDDQLVLTTGVTQTLDLALRGLIQPGDAVLVLEPVWFGATAMLALHQARVMSIPYGPQGPDPDLLARIVAREKPKVMIVSATAHNPTGITLPQETIDRIVEPPTRTA